MKISGLGLDLDGTPLFPPIEEDQAADALIQSLAQNAPGVKKVTATTSGAVSYRGESHRIVLDPGDPRVAGWAYLVNENDPHLSSIKEILRPLAVHRGMENPESPLLFHDEEEGEWFDWLHDNYYSLDLDGKKTPQYILIVGNPQRVPFRFQSVLDTAANVGRVDFDSLDDLQSYVEKVVRLDNADAPVVDRESIFFAPDAGLPDPTYFSREYMALPMAAHVHDTFGMNTVKIFGAEATRQNLKTALRTRKPGLVYTASHGLGLTNKPFDMQKRLNGAICCQTNGQLTLDDLFKAEDVPVDPFLEGAIFFQFACFGYGTPAMSDYAHWFDNVPEQYAEADFVAALPKKLLAHPRGPIAYIGHLDTAFLHGFADVEDPHILDRWHTRIAPFVSAVDRLLGVQPSGYAMLDMNTRYSVCNALITSTYDRYQRTPFEWTPERKQKFLDRWITRGDAQNYMVLGDPGARLRLPD